MFGEKDESKVSFSPRASWTERNGPGGLGTGRAGRRQCKHHPPAGARTWSSTVISVPSVLSVFHFSVNVSPYSVHLYLVSRLPVTLVVSVLAEPELVNSCRGGRQSRSRPACRPFTLRHPTLHFPTCSRWHLNGWEKANSAVHLSRGG